MFGIGPFELVLFTVFLALPMGILTSFIANRKGRGGIGWFFGGLFLGIFALIAICAIPAKRRED